MKISKQSRRDAKVLFRTCQVNGLLDDNRVRQAVQQVIAAKPRGYMAILHHFCHLVKLDTARRTVRVATAVPLTAAIQAGVQANLARLYGAGLSFTFEQNAALIGGMKITVGSDVYDGTMQGRLAALQESF